MALFHGFGVLPISNIVELLQGCSLCSKEGNREEEPVLLGHWNQALAASVNQRYLTSP
jgi:hypothetical protein